MRMPAVFAALLIACSAITSASAQTTRLTSEQAIEDLDRLYEGLRAANVNLFELTPEATFDDAYGVLRAQFEATDSLSSAELFLALQRFAALARQSHTRIEGLTPAWPEYAGGDGLLFPLRFDVHGGEIIVTAAPTDGPVQPGDRIISVDGLAAEEWTDRIIRNLSAETDEFAYAQLSFGEPYYVWLEFGARETFEVEIARDSADETHTLPAIPVSEVFSLQSADDRFTLEGREARFLTDTIGYFRPGPFSNPEAESPADAYSPDSIAIFEAFLDQAFTDFIDAGVEHVVIDLRDNPGGDNSFSDPIVAWIADRPFRFSSDFRVRVSEETIASNQARLDAMDDPAGSISARYAALFEPVEIGETVQFEIDWVDPRVGERFTGEVHVLVNRNSMSNAVTTAAMIQDCGFATIYGEPTRDMATTFGAMEHFTLPHSGFMVGYPKAHVIRPNGEETLHPLTPDVDIFVPAVRGGRDVMLETLVERLSEE